MQKLIIYALFDELSLKSENSKEVYIWIKIINK